MDLDHFAVERLNREIKAEGVDNILQMTKDITDKTNNVNDIIQVNIDMIMELDKLINQFKI